jgi:hypothetical protein
VLVIVDQVRGDGRQEGWGGELGPVIRLDDLD